jgi:hypothetical protein
VEVQEEDMVHMAGNMALEPRNDDDDDDDDESQQLQQGDGLRRQGAQQGQWQNEEAMDVGVDGEDEGEGEGEAAERRRSARNVGETGRVSAAGGEEEEEGKIGNAGDGGAQCALFFTPTH